MRILVTGASGFVGAALVRRLAAQGHEIVALTRPGSTPPPGCAALERDLAGAGRLALPQGVAAIVHLAQSRAYRAFPGDAREMFDVNVAGAQRLLEAAAEAGVSRFCMASTGTVYEPFVAPLREDDALAPSSYLGASKLAAEILARPFAGLFALSILRIFAPYGPGQTARLVPDLIARVREGVAVSLPESGGGMRFAPIHVEDLCATIETALAQNWTGVVNVGAPRALTIEDAARAIGEAVGRAPVFERKPLGAPVVVPDLTRLGERFDLTRIRPFEEGVRTMLAAPA